MTKFILLYYNIKHKQANRNQRMNSTKDEKAYNMSLRPKGGSKQNPVLKKDVVYVMDENQSTDYGRNEIVFNCSNLANNGKFCDFSQAYISIPVVATTLRSAHDEAVATAHKGLMLKSGPSMIDSLTVEYNNSTVLQQRRNIHGYCSFNQHTKLSQNDVNILDGFSYHKPSNKWSFIDDGKGLTSGDIVDDNHLLYAEPVLNTAHNGLLTASSLKGSGSDYYERDLSTNIFYFDQKIRLKDLLLFDKLPFVIGASLKITITLNQFHAVHTYSDANKITNSVQTVSGSSCPVLRCNAATMTTTGATETISVKVVSNGKYTHAKHQCRLYVPTYVLEASHELKLIQSGPKTISYTDVYVNFVKNLGSGDGSDFHFQQLLTNSISRLKRLIIIPMLNKASNEDVAVSESCFTSEPSTCTPNLIQDFNVLLSGSNLYSQPLKYRYDHYINELHGAYGIENGLMDGVSSSLISMRDYNNKFGYIVCDLTKRQLADENTPISVEITGVIKGTLKLDLLCYLEFEKDITINMMDGSLV